jgi:glycine/D-amino acid oxidase-like deaminating enzyme
MPEAWGESPWRVDVAIPPSVPPATVDVAVVGAGFAGLATAYELARRGLRPAVFEAGRIGSGASGSSGAVALEGTAIGLLDDADTCLATLERVTREARIECDLHLPGAWELTHDEVPGRAPLWRDGDKMLSVAGDVPGGTIDAGKVLAGLARAILATGGTIHEGTRVDRIDLGDARVLHTRDAHVTADRVVVAVNAFTPTVLRLPVDLRPVLTLAIATGALGPSVRDAIGFAGLRAFYTVDLPYLWGRPLGDDRVMVGSGLVFPDGADVRTARVDSDEGRAAFERIESRLRGLHPALASVAIERRWGGPICFVPSRAPILTQHPDDPKVVVSGGDAGHGVALSFRIGELVAEHITGGRALPAWGRIAAGD